MASIDPHVDAEIQTMIRDGLQRVSDSAKCAVMGAAMFLEQLEADRGQG